MDNLATEEQRQQLSVLKEEYIKLLNDKDVLLNWGKPQLEALYVSRIGRLQLERLQLQLQIKAVKRKIELPLTHYRLPTLHHQYFLHGFHFYFRPPRK